MANKEISVLLLDADENRANILESVFHECNNCSRIKRVNTIDEASSLLEESYKKNKVTPSLIIAYLLPEDAKFIKILKENASFRHIPLIGYGNINTTADLETYYREHINCFIIQPKTEAEFKDTFRNIFSFWGDIVKLVYNEKMLV